MPSYGDIERQSSLGSVNNSVSEPVDLASTGYITVHENYLGNNDSSCHFTVEVESTNRCSNPSPPTTESRQDSMQVPLHFLVNAVPQVSVHRPSVQYRKQTINVDESQGDYTGKH